MENYIKLYAVINDAV